MNSDVNPKMYGHVCFCVFGWVMNNAVGPNQKQKRKHNAESCARKRTLSMCLDWAFCPIYATVFFSESYGYCLGTHKSQQNTDF